MTAYALMKLYRIIEINENYVVRVLVDNSLIFSVIDGRRYHFDCHLFFFVSEQLWLNFREIWIIRIL